MVMYCFSPHVMYLNRLGENCISYVLEPFVAKIFSRGVVLCQSSPTIWIIRTNYEGISDKDCDKGGVLDCPEFIAEARVKEVCRNPFIWVFNEDYR